MGHQNLNVPRVSFDLYRFRLLPLREVPSNGPIEQIDFLDISQVGPWPQVPSMLNQKLRPEFSKEALSMFTRKQGGEVVSVSPSRNVSFRILVARGGLNTPIWCP